MNIGANKQELVLRLIDLLTKTANYGLRDNGRVKGAFLG